MAVPIPKFSILDDFEFLGSFGGEKPVAQRQWQASLHLGSLHGEVEVFNRRGHHLGALDPVTGELVKQAVPGRRIDV